MKRFTMILIVFSLLAGCARKKITEKEFNAVWGDYLQREFEEGFDEKQSASQKERIMKEVLAKYKLDLKEFKMYMQNKQADKYGRVF